MFDHYVAGDSPVSLDEFFRGYLSPGGAYWHESNFAGTCPGASVDYSNAGAALVGRLVETIADTPFDTFCRERIFEPLGMNDTSFRLADVQTGMLARPYDGGPGEFVPLVHYGFPTYPDGSLRATVPDLARFLGMMAGGGELDGTRILEAATVTEAAAVQLPELDDTQGLIWFYDHGDRLGHDGGDCGASSFMFYDPGNGRRRPARRQRRLARGHRGRRLAAGRRSVRAPARRSGGTLIRWSDYRFQRRCCC